MNTTSHPAEFATRMRNARLWKDQLIDGNFVDKWWVWWGGLKSDKDHNTAGPNSILLVVLGLAWWGAKASPKERKMDDEQGWLCAVHEVSETLDSLSSVSDGGDSKLRDK